MAVFFFILGAICFVLMEHPIVFWSIFLPLLIGFVAYSLKFIKKGAMKISDFVLAMAMLGLIVLVILWISA